MIPHIITPKSVTLIIQGKPRSLTNSHRNYERILEAIQKEDWDVIPDLVDVKGAITNFSDGSLSIIDNEVLWEGVPIRSSLTTAIIQQDEAGFNVTPLKNFFKKLMANPRYSVVNELWDFIDSCGDFVICEDGDFIAFKKVRHDFLDIHSASVDNTPGTQLPVLPWNNVDDNRNRTCSKGYHWCSYSYLSNYPGRPGYITVSVKVDPSTIAAIPSDYNNSKGRSTTYKILEVVDVEPEEYLKAAGPVYTAPTPTPVGDYEDEDEEDYIF